MSPSNGDDASRVAESVEAFCVEEPRVVVAFTAAAQERHQNLNPHQDDDNLDPEASQQTVRMGFKASCNPPVLSFRFHLNVFGHDDGKKVTTTLYFDVPRHHISSLEPTYHVDATTAPGLGQDDVQHFAGGLIRLRFRLRQAGHLVQPPFELALKPSSQRTLGSVALLAAALEFVVFMPHTALSKEQIQYFQQAIATTISAEQKAQQDKEHVCWLGALYGGDGGKLLNVDADSASRVSSPAASPAVSPVAGPSPDDNDATTASESGESTVAMATPPGYSTSAMSPESYDQDDASAVQDQEITASPPAYASLQSEANDLKGKQAAKRRYDSPQLDDRHCRRRLGSASRPADDESFLYFEKQQHDALLSKDPASLILSKLDQVLQRTQHLEDENKFLKTELQTELSAIRKSQHEMNAKIEKMIDSNEYHVKLTRDLQKECAQVDDQVAHLSQCHEDFEERLAELEERQEITEEKCSFIEVEIADQVHDNLRSRLISALETM